VGEVGACMLRLLVEGPKGQSHLFRPSAVTEGPNGFIFYFFLFFFIFFFLFTPFIGLISFRTIVSLSKLFLLKFYR